MDSKDTIRIFFPWKWILAATIFMIVAIAIIDATIGISCAGSAKVGEGAAKMVLSVWAVVSVCRYLAYSKKNKNNKT